MICYRDRAFCHSTECAKFKNCSMAYTDEVKAGAVRWWGSDRAPVALFVSQSDCFVKKDKNLVVLEQ